MSGQRSASPSSHLQGVEEERIEILPDVLLAFVDLRHLAGLSCVRKCTLTDILQIRENGPPRVLRGCNDQSMQHQRNWLYSGVCGQRCPTDHECPPDDDHLMWSPNTYTTPNHGKTSADPPACDQTKAQSIHQYLANPLRCDAVWKMRDSMLQNLQVLFTSARVRPGRRHLLFAQLLGFPHFCLGY